MTRPARARAESAASPEALLGEEARERVRGYTRHWDLAGDAVHEVRTQRSALPSTLCEVPDFFGTQTGERLAVIELELAEFEDELGSCVAAGFQVNPPDARLDFLRLPFAYR